MLAFVIGLRSTLHCTFSAVHLLSTPPFPHVTPSAGRLSAGWFSFCTNFVFLNFFEGNLPVGRLLRQDPGGAKNPKNRARWVPKTHRFQTSFLIALFSIFTGFWLPFRLRFLSFFMIFASLFRASILHRFFTDFGMVFH